MKLTCDICGASLQMASGGNGAVCTNCSVTYDIARLKEKLGEAPAQANKRPNVSGSANYRYAATQTEEPSRNSQQSPESVSDNSRHYIQIKRLRDFHICKIAVFLDDNPAITLEGQGKITTIPVSAGTHKIGFQIASGAGLITLEEQTFTVTNYDWYGEVGLSRGAFKAAYTFKMRELR